MTRPFLSVVMRTRGDRGRPFHEALRSLAQQRDHDLELIVVVHGDAPDLVGTVSDAVAEHAGVIASSTRVVAARGGGRSVPLNVAVELVDGERVAFLDDDDLVLPGWVEEFHSAAPLADGRLIRAGVLVEEVGSAPGDRELGYHDAFPLRFDMLRHVLTNESPFMGWAFPAELFTERGLRFDEQLAVCEDWELVMRAVQLVGVLEVASYTAVYRHWPGRESSTVSHQDAIWRAAEAEVVRRLDADRLVLPPGSVPRIREVLATEAEVEALQSTRAWAIAKRLERVWRSTLGRSSR